MLASRVSSSSIRDVDHPTTVLRGPRWMLLQQRRRIGNNSSKSAAAATSPLWKRGDTNKKQLWPVAAAATVSSPFRRRTESVSTVSSSLSGSGLVIARRESSMRDDDVMQQDTMAADLDNSVMMTDAAAAFTHDSSTTTQTSRLNIMEWLQTECPVDVVPMVLSFCSPQQTSALSRTNHHWHDVMHREETWRVLCEGQYKWKQGEPEPDSWFDLYRSSPCVPVEYSSIPKALSLALEIPCPSHRRRNVPAPSIHQVRDVRVLLRPGKYYLKQAIDVRALPGVTVSLETVELPKNVYKPTRQFLEVMEQPLPMQEAALEPNSPTSKRGQSFRKLFSCYRQESTEETDHDETDGFDEWDSNHQLNGNHPPKQAILVLRSRTHNEPAFRVRQGVLRLRNLEIQHNSHGLDIWNGNAAVQIQPPLSDDQQRHEIVEPRPTACLHRVHITSKSGRGIVNIDGGKLTLRRCAVTDCAATGVYVGGPGSQATIDRTDVIRNGVGNSSRRGIARGHSGVYLEQGVATVRQSNVSHNTLTGISVVSSDNALLTLHDSTLVGNGTYQLELPPPGSLSRIRSVVASNNVMAIRGEARSRSGILSSSSSVAVEGSSSSSSSNLPPHPLAGDLIPPIW